MIEKIKNLLRELETTRETFWNISPETGRFLNLLVQEQKYKTILEIGTSNGYSGIWLAEALSHTGGILQTMESHKKKRFFLASENFQKSGLQKYIHQILGHAPEALPKTPKMFDLIFLDATKEEYIEHFEALKNRVKKGGMIIADNFYSHAEAMKDFTKAIKKEPGWKCFELAIGTGLLVAIHQP